MKHTGRATHFESFQLFLRCCEVILCPSDILLQVVVPFLQLPQLATGYLCRAGSM